MTTVDVERAGLVVRGMTVSFGDVLAVAGVSLDISSSGCAGLIGPNGSGKSTLLNSLSGYVAAKGEVSLDGTRIPLGRPRAAVAAGLSRTFQTPQTFHSLTCRENVLLGMTREGGCGVTSAWVLRRRMQRAEKERIDRADAFLARVGILPRAGDMAGDLSYGEQRRLELARALATGPKMILLDEPAAGLNQAETAQLASIIEEFREAGIGIFLVEHKLDFVTRLCSTISVLALGEVIASGRPAEVLEDRAVMDAYLGIRARA
jgi:ABC-type branched-subunit amino acid transport system ATPase component